MTNEKVTIGVVVGVVVAGLLGYSLYRWLKRPAETVEGYRCPYCGEVFTTYQESITHVLTMHPGEPPEVIPPSEPPEVPIAIRPGVDFSITVDTQVVSQAWRSEGSTINLSWDMPIYRQMPYINFMVKFGIDGTLTDAQVSAHRPYVRCTFEAPAGVVVYDRNEYLSPFDGYKRVIFEDCPVGPGTYTVRAYLLWGETIVGETGAVFIL